MSDYFSTVRSELAAAVEQRAHLPWWRRVRLTHGRALAVVFAVLVVASPGVAAVGGLFSQGQPNSTGPTSPGRLDGTSGQVIRESCRSRFLTCRAVRRGVCAW